MAITDKSFIFDGTDMRSHGLTVVDWDIPEFPPVIAEAHTPLEGDTEISSVSFGPREITLDCAVTATSEANLQTAMDAIKKVCNPLLTDKVLTIDDAEPSRQYRGRFLAASSQRVKGKWGAIFSFTFLGRPYKEATSATTGTDTISADPEAWAISSVTGTANRIPLMVYVRNTTGGNTTNAIVLTNTTNSETITWTGTLEDDRWLRFGFFATDGRYETSISKSDSTGADATAEDYTSVISGYTSGDWVRLKGGETNNLTIAGLSAGSIAWEYTGRYL